ncbi:HAD family hydrolase [Sphaerisporangium perillae]|uniref:HAD family hydrolase n=1 Tax=Sphaerisporangium perillae TaxID=2935860 RepID=UPI00200D3EAA|nr:HAD-IB family hydrolase [Sphaerisporangium perillae]
MRRLLRRHTEAEMAGEVAAAAAVAAPVATPDPTAAAFFDVDNTMMRGASIYHFARGLASRGLFTTKDLVKFALGQALFRVRGNENPEHIAQAKETALAFVVGLKVDDVVRLGEEIYDEVMADRIWAGTRALAQNHLDAGQRVWLVTATPVELSRVIAQRLGLTGALGTVAETENGVYTGRLVGDLLHGPAKSEAVKALARREGLDLSRCTAYSDSANDLPLLQLVGHACAINPDSDLLEFARKHDWAVRDFRTGRKATMIGLPIAAGAGAVAGGVAAAIALRKHYRSA